jgi:hypothetical protein
VPTCDKEEQVQKRREGMNLFQEEEERVVEEPEEWVPLDESWYDDLDDSNHSVPIVGSLPPQLHPAVSIGMMRVSSCYFSIQSSEASNSVADLLSLWEESNMMEESNEEQDRTQVNEETRSQSVKLNASDILYHDIMMHVFTFLDGKAMAAFSETAKRPNFECFYFLQLQLQRAMIVDSSNEKPCDSLDAIAGVGSISRLMDMDPKVAMAIVQEYQDSNSTLRTMPLSHSLAYIRQVLRRHGFHAQEGSQPNALASAAVLITLVGAASYMGSSTEVLPNPNTLLKMGLAGSLMKAGVTAREQARKMSDDDHPVTMRHTAEQMARMMQEVPSQLFQQLQSNAMQERKHEPSFPSSIASRMYAAFSSAYGPANTTNKASPMNRSQGQRPRRSKRSHKGDVSRQDPSIARIDEEGQGGLLHPMTPNPYEHLPETLEEESQSTLKPDAETVSSFDSHKMPSGCVGAYSRAVQQAASRVTQLLKEKRKSNYEALSLNEQLQYTTAFIDACSSDDTLATVKDMAQKRNMIDVDGFYVGSDGTETCALHTAAFHGACRVLTFLCSGIDENSADQDGGLVDVNLKDANGWTAMHFAAGANSVEAVQILSRHGSQLAVEAANGYTPFHWAQRLSNDDVAEELKRLGADQRFLEIGWIRSQPLSVIASRFFSLIPTH